MKKLTTLLLLCCLALLPLTGCQANKQNAEQPATPTLAELPETKDMTIMVEGMEETVVVQKAMHEDFYALYYEPDSLIYVPGEVLEDGSFVDVFISAYDDELTEVPTTMEVCYTPNITPKDWAASVTPRRASFDSFFGGAWEITEETTLINETEFQIWDGTNNFVQNICYTTPFRDGCLAITISYPNKSEYIEGWGTRLGAAAHTLVLAAE